MKTLKSKQSISIDHRAYGRIHHDITHTGHNPYSRRSTKNFGESSLRSDGNFDFDTRLESDGGL
jgi:hypothetical protein